MDLLSRVKRRPLGVEGALRLAPGSLEHSPLPWKLCDVHSTGWLRWRRVGEDRSWTQNLADAVCKLPKHLMEDMASFKKLAPLHVEWCETEMQRAKGFATTTPAACQILRDRTNGTFPSLPMPMAERVHTFLSTTFHDEVHALNCVFAALELAPRGRNVDRAFWTLGAGGVGQSLSTHLIAGSVGRHNHHFVDLNVYYTDDELRKQGEFLWKGGRHGARDGGQQQRDARGPVQETYQRRSCRCSPPTHQRNQTS